MIVRRSSEPDGGRLLLDAVRSVQSAVDLNDPEWDLLLPLAHRNRLLGRLGEQLAAEGSLDRIPPKASEILESSRVLLEHRQRLLLWELDRIAWALAETGIQPVVLKGGAYLLADLPVAKGRISADVDLMVPRERLGECESALLARGWLSQKRNSYDQRYYREWMHELPPMRHAEREIEVDLHHTILPLTSRLTPPAEILFASASEVPETGYMVLSPPDMLLHSATHLFHDGEITGGLRDLLDINDLLIHFGGESGFWSDLISRAELLDLTRPLFFALRFSKALLQTLIPEDVIRESERFAPNPIARAFMDAAVTRVLTTHHTDRASAPIAAWLLYVRSHWLRMPPRLLLPHLARKGWMRIKSSEAD
jgi:hypothetical protein